VATQRGDLRMSYEGAFVICFHLIKKLLMDLVIEDVKVGCS